MADELTRRALFREVNAKICEIDAGFGVAGPTYQLLCECGRPDCYVRFEVPAALYDDLLEREDAFIVATGHERPADALLSSSPAYTVVVSRHGLAEERVATAIALADAAPA